MSAREIKLEFAGRSDIPGLFKFRKCSDDQDIARIDQLLSGQLYFATSSQLNDPFEMKMRLVPDPDEHARRKRLMRSLKEGEYLGKLSPAARLMRSGQLSNRIKLQPKVLEEAADNNYLRMQQNCFVFCASATREHPLLWSHYADMHRGVCIQLDHNILPLASACKVDYSKSYPVATYPFRNDDELIRKGILTKAEYWAYEKEFRLFSLRINNPTWHLGVDWPDEHVARFDPKTAVSIVIGARMPEKIERKILDLCKKKYPHIGVERAVLSDKEFRIGFESV